MSTEGAGSGAATDGVATFRVKSGLAQMLKGALYLFVCFGVFNADACTNFSFL